MANRTSRGADAPRAAHAATEPGLGFFLPEDAHTRLERAAVIAELLAGCFGECLDGHGKPLLLDARQIAALGEYLGEDLRAALAAIGDRDGLSREPAPEPSAAD